MTLRLPFNALHIFCVVVKEGGFRQASEVLHLTPGAISRQIQMLEECLKQVLFDRGSGSSATLTPEGRQLHAQVADKMTDITEVLGGGSRTRCQVTILVDTSVTLAMHWLIPQLSVFMEHYPHIHVHVRTTEGNANPSAPVDVFLRRDAAELRGLPAQVFMAERSVLVASPHFASTIVDRKLKDMGYLTKLPRIGTHSRPDLWQSWRKCHGMDDKLLKPTLEFDNTILAIQAAIQGMGVLVVPEVFISTLLNSNALTLLHSSRIDTGSYSIAIGRQRNSSHVAVFAEWLKTRGCSE